MKEFLMHFVLPLSLLAFLFGVVWANDWRMRRRFDRDVKEGRIKLMSHAEYNRAFGIQQPSLKSVKKP